MRVALLKFNEEYTQDLDLLFKSVGMNTGNLVYWQAIQRLFDVEIVDFRETEKLKDFDAVIITDLCWITENAERTYIETYVDKFNIPFIPMSIGLQNSSTTKNFKLSDQIVRLLNKMQQRAVLGVRGEYTAKVLREYGITNIAVIGCPSMYYWNNRNLNIEDNSAPINVCANFKSFGWELSAKDSAILDFYRKNNFLFVEQTFRRINLLSKEYEKYLDYLWNNTLLEFNYSNWADKLKDYNFSMGLRFHGNVISLQQNIKALFITIDSRTQEMIDLFHLPFITLDKFNPNASVSSYFELADYSEFNRNYAQMFDRFMKFVKDNSLTISEKAVPLAFKAKNNIPPLNGNSISIYSKYKPLYIAPSNLLDKKFISVITKYNDYIDINSENEEDALAKLPNRQGDNILKDSSLSNITGFSSCWKHIHSKLSVFDITTKCLKTFDETPCWNILAQKIDHKPYKGDMLTIKVISKCYDGSMLNIFARYLLEDKMHYLKVQPISSDDEKTTLVTFNIPENIPDNAELYVGVYLNTPYSQAIVKQIELSVDVK